jgi:hypothetical protein
MVGLAHNTHPLLHPVAVVAAKSVDVLGIFAKNGHSSYFHPKHARLHPHSTVHRNFLESIFRPSSSPHVTDYYIHHLSGLDNEDT